jgi:AraC-like DNA-binding protein
MMNTIYESESGPHEEALGQLIVLSSESFSSAENRHDLTHWHGMFELIRIMDGTAHCVINGEDYLLEEGDVCAINRLQLHRMYCDVENCMFQRLLVDPALFAPYKAVYQRYLVPILTDESFAHMRIAKRDATHIVHTIDHMAEANEMKPLAYELELIAMTYLIFQQLFVIYRSAKKKDSVPPSADLILFRRMAGFVHQHCQERLSLEDIAAAGNVSKSKCGQVFKKYAGQTPIEFLNLYRLSLSAEMLSSSEKSIAEIASSCGFGQQSYYNRLFLREYGMTPNEYRGRQRANT